MSKVPDAKWTTGSPSVVKTFFFCHSGQQKNRCILISAELSANGQVPYRRWLETQRAHEYMSQIVLVSSGSLQGVALVFQADLQRIIR